MPRPGSVTPFARHTRCPPRRCHRSVSASMTDAALPASIDELQALLTRQRYVADRGLATSIYLALRLHRPLLLEGEAGVGKTEVAKVLAAGFDTELIRLQCYERLDITHAVYEWNYARQLLEIRLREAGGPVDRAAVAAHFPRLGRALKAVTGATGFNVLANEGEVAGQEVGHVHFHLIPRAADDGLGYRWNPTKYPPGRMDELAERYSTALCGDG